MVSNLSDVVYYVNIVVYRLTSFARSATGLIAVVVDVCVTSVGAIRACSSGTCWTAIELITI